MVSIEEKHCLFHVALHILSFFRVSVTGNNAPRQWSPLLKLLGS
jgi:hypothetical protein